MRTSTNVLAGLVLLLTSCAKNGAPEQAADSGQLDTAVALEAVEAPPAPAAPVASPADYAVRPEPIAGGSSGPVSIPTVTAGRQIIYKADVSIKVADLARATARVDSLVRRSGSWVGAAAQSRSDEEWRQEMTLRVRPDKFAGLLTGLSTLGTVERKVLTSEDVTAEHADVAARLRTKRALEQRYLGLLKQAKKVSEVLEIEAKIGETREEIEATESRLKALNDQIAYSVITLKLYQPLTLPTPDVPVLSFSSRIAEAFYGGWQLITSLVIGAVHIWPLLLLGLGGFVLLKRLRKRRLA